MKIEIIRDGKAIAASEQKNETYLVFQEEYQEGDTIALYPESKGFITLQLDAVLGRATLYADGTPFLLPVPFGQKHDCYHESVFKGCKHFLWARNAYEWEYDGYRNLALNPYDAHENSALFPHAKANIETRGESVFAARNAIDGIVASNGHGTWPWSSWGINRDPEAELSLDFGRTVAIDRIIFYTRADFPHDAWWTEGTLSFSDGSEIKAKLEKKDGAQTITFPEKKVTALKLSHLIKADDPSPFPALIQLEAYGREC
ncbi:MAG: carbohydrate-binding protein [Spirochaetes bacterium]|uniref:Carbohydrate-binding protein n=1 Tax=Candidatus Ornithospirochaeta stercoripullorum TaxID=2840899 RepID=A0A9D9E2V3_9SPIO|nr:carbohydrate-binding protein [Candidatus Ornithospirochaeta stercoripullorum]